MNFARSEIPTPASTTSTNEANADNDSVGTGAPPPPTMTTRRSTRNRVPPDYFGLLAHAKRGGV